MALLTITAVPGEAQRELFDLWLQAGDVIVVREDRKKENTKGGNKKDRRIRKRSKKNKEKK